MCTEHIRIECNISVFQYSAFTDCITPLFVPSRYRVKRTCRSESIVTDCVLPCGPAAWESLTPASTKHRMVLSGASTRHQVKMSSSLKLPYYIKFSLPKRPSNYVSVFCRTTIKIRSVGFLLFASLSMIAGANRPFVMSQTLV